MSDNDVKADEIKTSSEEEQDEQDITVDDIDMVESLQQAQANLVEAQDQILRLKAEMENLRRRSAREVENAHKYALERFVQDLLPVIDSLEMGRDASMAEGATLEKLQEGTDLTLKMLLSTIDKFGIKAVHPQGEPFDPELHQAMSMQESAEHAPNTVMNVMQKGYLLNDRLVRPAMVIVSKTAEDTEKTGANVDEKA
ncbi:Heat shock protein GrpE [hydrothermal vent metagenome]|uniref:Heat shock protein GrpE n=1 Tax=hydrothermal vent metagenome TaxID=652676 RepID=A0A3B1C3S0_9ZZZZ